MSAIRLYLDEDAGQHGLLDALRLRLVEVTRAQDVGLIEATDREQLEWCRHHGLVLYSFNVGHFLALHRQFLVGHEEHAGIILALQQRYSIGEQMRRLMKIVVAKSTEDMKNQLEFLSDWS